jgi:hypothetical protein
MDDQSELRVEICAESQALADQVAVGCAQSGAPATVQKCRCETMDAPRCPAGDCKVHEYR